MEFYSETSQRITEAVRMLPQRGAASGGTGRPLNSFAILRAEHSVLVDAGYSWTRDGIRQLVEDGFPPRALVLSHRDTVMSSDALADLAGELDVPVFLHPYDLDAAASEHAGVPLRDPLESALLRDSGIQVLAIPGHTPGSIMLYLAEAAGVLLAGDSAVAPGPRQEAEPPRLERPVMDEATQARFVTRWQEIVETRALSAILPLHGRVYLRDRLGEEAFMHALTNIWRGAAMDASG